MGGPASLETRPQLRDVARHWATAPDAAAAGHVVVFSSLERLTGREKRENQCSCGPACWLQAGICVAAAAEGTGGRSGSYPTQSPPSCVTLGLLNLQRLLVEGVRRRGPTLLSSLQAALKKKLLK